MNKPALKSMIVVSNGNLFVSLSDLLRSLLIRRRLRPLLYQALAEKLMLQRAAEAGITVSDRELQQAADRFRHRHGLVKADQLHRWLGDQGLTIEDFEAGLERGLFIDNFKCHITEPLLAQRFNDQRDRYACARLRQIIVPSEGMARELLSQIHDEGLDFGELARQHSVHGPSRLAGGSIGVVGRYAMTVTIGSAVFSAQAGSIVGPWPSEAGFRLLMVEELLPPELNTVTAAVIASELFDAWLSQQLQNVRIDLSCLELAP